MVLGPGEMFVVPRGVRLCPVADEESRVLILEPRETLNTGDARPGRHHRRAARLADPQVRTIVVEHPGRLARFGVEQVAAALSAQGRRILVADPAETTDDLAWDMIEVLTGFCARLYGRRGARNRALRAVTCAKRPLDSPLDPDPAGGDGRDA